MSIARKREYGVVNCVEGKLRHLSKDVTILMQYIEDETYIPVDAQLYDDVFTQLSNLASSYRIVKRAALRELPRDIWTIIAEHLSPFLIRTMRLVSKRLNNIFSAHVYNLRIPPVITNNVPTTLLTTFKNVRVWNIEGERTPKMMCRIFSQGRAGLKFIQKSDAWCGNGVGLFHWEANLNGADLDMGNCDPLRSLVLTGVRCLIAQSYHDWYVKSAQCAVLPLSYCLQLNCESYLGTIAAVFIQCDVCYMPPVSERFPSQVTVYMDATLSDMYNRAEWMQVFFSKTVVHLWDGAVPAFFVQ